MPPIWTVCFDGLGFCDGSGGGGGRFEFFIVGGGIGILRWRNSFLCIL